MANVYREAIANLEKPWRNHDYSIEGKLENYVYSTNYINHVGKDYNFSHPKILMRMFYLIKTDLSMARLSLAIAGYANQHEGELPQDLAELVPDYIDEIPVDLMDHQPLRYNRDKRIIWSICFNCIDDNGERATPTKALDDVVEIPLPKD